MAADGDGRKDAGDKFAFHGADPADRLSTPVRLYVNAPGVKAAGESCSDGYGNYSVLGSSTTPRIGGPLKLEAFGLPPSTAALLMISVGGNVPGFDMAPMGAPGCVLRTLMQLQVMLPISAGNAAHADGSLVLSSQVPNDPLIRGYVFSAQIGAIDKNSKRAFPMIVTNAIELTVQ